MRVAVCFLVFGLYLGSGFADKAREPLPDYVGRFAELDAKLRAIDDADPTCTNYVAWIQEAIECKRELKQREKITPWVYDLAGTYTNNWKIQHACAQGFSAYGYDRERRSFQCMDLAFRLAREQGADDRAMGQLLLDYIDLLLADCEEHPHRLQVKSPGATAEQYQADVHSLGNFSVTNSAGEEVLCSAFEYNTPEGLTDAEFERQRMLASPDLKRFFYKLPASYEAAENDGELVRWLIENRPSDGYGHNVFQRKWTLADFAVFIAGSHLNLSCDEDSILGKYSRVPSKADRELLAAIKDNETIIWGNEYVSNRVIQLPEAYCYIPEYIQRAEQGDQDAAETLGNIFINRCQLERAACYFELAGETNKVQSIRGDQGTILAHRPYPEGVPSTVEYVYRNAPEVTIEIYPLTIDTNLLSRFITGGMWESELRLLEADAYGYQNTTQTNQFILSDAPVKAWTHHLSPLLDHQDALEVIQIPELKSGIYLLRALLEKGNTAETVLHVYDTLLYSADFYSFEKYTYDRKELYVLCEALTGKPIPGADLHFFDLSKGGSRNDYKWIDGCYHVDQYKHGKTNREGIYLAEKHDWTVLARLNHRLPFAVDQASARFYLHDTRPYWEQESDLDTLPIFMTSDRPLYRPGDSGHIKLWIPKADSPLTDVTLQKDAYKIPLTAVSSNLEEWSGRDSFGGMEYSFDIPSNAPLGKYEYRLPSGQKSELWIEKYRVPEFDITATLTTNQTIEINAGYMYGGALPEGKLDFWFEFNPQPQPLWHPAASFDFLWGNGYWWNGRQFLSPSDESIADISDCFTSVHTNLDRSGQFTYDLSSEEEMMSALAIPGYFNLSATVTDASLKQFTKRIILPVAFPDRSLCCWMDKAFYAEDERMVCHTAFENQAGPLNLVICSLTNETPIQTFPVHTEEDVQLEPLPPGIYQACLKSEVFESSAFQFAVLGDSLASPAGSEPIRLIVEKGQYATGETARLLVLVDKPGRYVYWFDRAGDPYGLTTPPSVFQMDATYKVLSLPLTKDGDDLAGIFKSAAMTIADGKHYLAHCTMPIIGSNMEAGTLVLKTEKKTYGPGENVTLSTQSLDSDGKGIPSSVTVTVYNRSLDLLASTVQTPNILKTLFGSWANQLHNLLEVSNPYRTIIRAVCPDSVMQLLMPQGDLPFMYGLSLDTTSVFGSAMEMGHNLAEDLDSLDLDVNILPVREDFRDLAFWNGSVITDSNGCAEVTFPMPDGLVEWKVKAWAMHTNYASSATTTLRCSKDFVIQLNSPRFMTEGDRLEISSSLRNHTTNALDVMASCSESGSVIRVESPGKVGPPSLAPNQQSLAYWDLFATTSGVSYITTTAYSDNGSDGMKMPIPVHPHGMMKRGGEGGVLSEKSNVQDIKIEIPKDTVPESVDLKLNCSTDMLDALIGALPFLADYPHGCTEQTLNRFLPAVITLQTMDELGIDILTKTNAMPAGRETLFNRDRILTRAQVGIDRLEDAQHNSGTWGWNLKGDRSRRDYLITAWVLRGLHRASQVESLKVSRRTIRESMESLLDYMDDQLQSSTEEAPRNISDLDAMVGCVVSEVGIDAETRYNKSIKDDQATLIAFLAHLLSRADELSLYGKILLANAFDQQGDDVSRDRIITFIEQYLEYDSNLGTYWLRTSSADWWYWYNDHIETLAWYLKLLNQTEPSSAKTAGVVRYLMQNRIYGDHWKSTRDTAICIEALCEYAANNRTEPEAAAYQVVLNGSPVPYCASGRYEMQSLRAGENTLRVQSSGNTPVFYDATWQYYSRENPIAAEACDLVTISRTYYRENPVPDQQEDVPIHQGDVVKSGENIKVVLTLQASQTLEYLLAQDFKPAGFECEETLSGYDYGDGLSYYQELHDERVSFYINGLPKGISTIRYWIRAEHAGLMSALPATVEMMYAPRQAANTDEDVLRVER